MTPESLARLFHETYERLAPRYGYATREESAVAWESLPNDNRHLMTAVAKEVLEELKERGLIEERFWPFF